MLYTYEWVDGWIDKQTVKLCWKLHSTRRVYNLDLIKLILKNTTDIIFFPGQWLLVCFHPEKQIAFKAQSCFSVCNVENASAGLRGCVLFVHRENP